MHQQLAPFPPQVQPYGTPPQYVGTSPYQGPPLPMYCQIFLGKYPVGYFGHNTISPINFGPPCPTSSGMDLPTTSYKGIPTYAPPPQSLPYPQPIAPSVEASSQPTHQA